jgi:hypothetical protein
MGAIEVGYVSSIDIQRGIRRFGRKQHEKNAPNVWFVGIENMRRTFDFIFYISLWLQHMWVMCPTSTFKG